MQQISGESIVRRQLEQPCKGHDSPEMFLQWWEPHKTHRMRFVGPMWKCEFCGKSQQAGVATTASSLIKQCRLGVSSNQGSAHKAVQAIRSLDARKCGATAQEKRAFFRLDNTGSSGITGFCPDPTGPPEIQLQLLQPDMGSVASCNNSSPPKDVGSNPAPPEHGGTSSLAVLSQLQGTKSYHSQGSGCCP